MKKKRKISFFQILRLMGIVLFIVILSRVDLRSITGVLGQISISLFLYGVLFQILLLIFKGIRWHVMNDGSRQKKHWIRSLGRFFESYAIGVVTPGRLGEVMKAGHEKDKSDKAGAFIRVISERGFDVGIFILIAVLALFFGKVIHLDTWMKWLFLVMGSGLLVLSYLLLSSPKTLKLIQNIINYILKKSSAIALREKQYQKGTVSLIFILSLLSNFSYFISCYFLAQSVGLHVGLIDVSAGVALAGLLNMLPITIMGLGTRELIFLTVFSTFAKSLILAFSITILLVAQIGGGLIAMVLGQILLFMDKKARAANA